MVWLKAEAGVAVGMELQGQEDAGARVASGVCVDSVQNYLSGWSGHMSLLSAWPGAFYLRGQGPSI